MTTTKPSAAIIAEQRVKLAKLGLTIDDAGRVARIEDPCNPEPASLSKARLDYLASGDPNAAAVIARTETPWRI